MSLKPSVKVVDPATLVCRRKKLKPELVEDWPLALIKEHPLQYFYFKRPTRAEVEALAEDMERNGQIEPAEITPDGILIAGYKRVEARRFSGKDSIRVLIRHDLAGNAKAIERRLIESNENRRHLSRLERAKLQLRMWELSPAANTRKGRGDINREIVATLQISDRQVRKYCVLLRGPVELLQAVEDGRLKFSLAIKVLRLPDDQAAPILALLRGEPGNRAVKAIVKEAVNGAQTSKAPKPAALFAKFLKVGTELVAHVAELKMLVTDSQRKDLTKLRRLLDKVEGKSNSAA